MAFKGLEKKIKKLPTFTWHILEKKKTKKVVDKKEELVIK